MQGASALGAMAQARQVSMPQSAGTHKRIRRSKQRPRCPARCQYSGRCATSARAPRRRTPAESRQKRYRAIVHGELGYIYGLLTGDLVSAEGHCRASVRLSPASELPSLGLFHTLVKLDRWEDALREVVHFLELR